jgi:hypothetical protein
MIAVEKQGSNFMGALGYNLKKMNHPDPRQRAELLATSFSSLSPARIQKEVELIRHLRPALAKYVWHTSLNFSNAENPGSLTSSRMLEMALDYMKAMGYDDNQYLIVRHHDAGHEHVHLLVNRLRYDGSVVSDSNNYRKSQSTLRKLEHQYNLIPIEQHNNKTEEQNNPITEEQNIPITSQQHNTTTSQQHNGVTKEQRNTITRQQHNHITTEQNNAVTIHQPNNVAFEQNNGPTNGNRKLASQRSLTKNEIEKTIRTNQPSDKSILQALLNPILSKPGLSLQRFIQECDENNVYLLFNQASTGNVSGITYFINDFKIKGQALGNRFKWAELIKHIDYEQDRDSKAISQANGRTKAAYNTGIGGQQAAGSKYRQPGSDRLYPGDTGDIERGHGKQGLNEENGTAADTGRTDSPETSSIGDSVAGVIGDDEPYNIGSTGLEITDDVDDEAVHGGKRRKHRRGFSR